MREITNPTDILRQYAAANSVIKKSETKAALNFTQNQINSSFDRLVQCKQLTRIGHGIYKFETTITTNIPDVTEKIWRAMKVKRVFSASDIALLAETTIAYVYKLFRTYRADGYLKAAGVRKPTYGSGSEKQYRLTIKGQNKARKPNVEQFKPDPLVMDAVNLNRLVCSGLVIREERSARDAIGICKRMIASLQADMEG